MKEVFALQTLPPNYETLVLELIRTTDFEVMKANARLLLRSTRDLLIHAILELEKSERTHDDQQVFKQHFADRFIAANKMLNKVIAGCKAKDCFLASYAATECQMLGMLKTLVSTFRFFHELFFFAV